MLHARVGVSAREQFTHPISRSLSLCLFTTSMAEIDYMKLPNLASLQNFSRDLNYSGVTSEGWDDPFNILPLGLLLLCLATVGLPRSLLAFWVLLNTALIHPMDFIVGALGRGPRYLADEYAVMDTRYWPLDDPTVAWISYLELAVYVPLGYFWYKGVVENKWFRHFHALLVSTFQLMGCILYLGCEWHLGFPHLPAPDWPWPTFNSYLKLKYFWLIFVGCNGVWIVVPLLVYWHTFSEMASLLQSKTSKSKTQ